MKLTRNDLFSAQGPAWRVEGRIWGPYCYSRRSAVWQWLRVNVGLQPSCKNPNYQYKPKK
jgi:hypothetical protein